MTKINEQLDSEKLNVDYWNNFYSKVTIRSESTFCTYVKEIIDSNTMILDVGCGSGRDAFSFAKSGYDIIGIDRSVEAINLNKLLYEELKIADLNINFYPVDISDEDKLKECFEELCRTASGSKKKIAIYLRFLLHSINEFTEEILLSVIARYLRSGDYFAAEFRTIEDQQRVKVYNDHYRRFIVAEELLHRLEHKHGFRKIEFHKGTGLSVFNNEDPYLARIIMEKK